MSPGGRPRTITDDEIIRYLRGSDERVLTTSEIAEEFDVSSRTAQRRLSALDDEGRVVRKDVGARGAVWWAADSAPGASAAPLRRLVGELDTAVADSARRRSDAWRDSFDEEIAPDGA